MTDSLTTELPPATTSRAGSSRASSAAVSAGVATRNADASQAELDELVAIVTCLRIEP